MLKFFLSHVVLLASYLLCILYFFPLLCVVYLTSIAGLERFPYTISSHSYLSAFITSNIL